MFRSMSIRTSLTLVIGSLGAILLAVIAVGTLSLQFSNNALQSMYRDQISQLSALKNSYENLLHARLLVTKEGKQKGSI